MADVIAMTRPPGAMRLAIFAATFTCHFAVYTLPLAAQEPVKVSRGVSRLGQTDNALQRRTIPISVVPWRVATLELTTRGRVLNYVEPPPIEGGQVAGAACGETSHADASAFEPGAEVLVQAGFAEGEIAWAMYEVDPASFPVRIDVMEFMLVKPNASADVVVEWSLLVWDGPPLDGIGLPIFSAESIGAVIPTARIVPGVDALLIIITVDPDDPEPIVINNDTGQNSFTVGFRIDQHNAPSSNPCIVGPDRENNAFPAVDLTPPSLTGNWLTGLESCLFCGGTNSFAMLDTQCRPSGNWLIRTTFSCTLEGACCNVDAVCSDNVQDLTCVEQGGTFMGGDSLCSAVTCPAPVGACCVSGAAGQSCGDALVEVLCEGLAGVYMGNGAQCSIVDCSLGACCLPDGSCADMIGLECDRAAGLFRGSGSECVSTLDCPEPRGSCCSGTTCVPDQTISFCEAIVGVFNGIGSTCDVNTCLCPSATIVASDPPDGTVDARQPHTPDDPTDRQGIGTLAEPIVITLDPPVTGANTLSCWSLCESPADPLRAENSVLSVTDLGGGQYEIILNHALEPGTITSITYADGSSAVRYTTHPANVDAGIDANGQDFAFARAVLSGMETAPHGLYSIDLDHSGAMGPGDLLRLIDVLIGGATFDAWLDSPRPVNDTCP